MVEKGTVPNRAWHTKSTVPKEGMAELGFCMGGWFEKISNPDSASACHSSSIDHAVKEMWLSVKSRSTLK